MKISRIYMYVFQDNCYEYFIVEFADCCAVSKVAEKIYYCRIRRKLIKSMENR